MQCLDDLQFKYIFHKQSGSESEIKVKARSGYGPEKEEKKNSDPQHWLKIMIATFGRLDF